MNLTGQKILAPFFLALFLLAGFLSPVRAETVVEDVPARVFSEASSIDLERPFWLAFRIYPKPGQYVPYVDLETGDRGLVADFALPPGFEKGEILQSTPSLLFEGELYGYDQPFWVLQEIIPGHDAEFQETYVFPGQASWVECFETECLDYEKEASLELPYGPGHPSIKTRKIFEAARETLPKQMRWPAKFSAGGGRFRLMIYVGDEELGLENAVVLLSQGKTANILNDALQGQNLNGAVTIEGRPVAYLPRPNLSAILLVPGTPDQGYILEVKNEFETRQSLSLSAPGFSGITIWLAIGLAFLGGLILNLMPCVFPVLTLKVFGLVKAGTISPRAMKIDGLAYTLGILMTFVFVALLLLTFREAGEQVGWGFQLQSPYFVTVLGLLLLVVTLNFAGLFEFRLPFSVATGPAAEGPLGSLYTGMLATVVATPCTAPFMAPALGFALTLSTMEALWVFISLGLGLAAPYLVVSFIPKIQKLFPKPGPWMETLKKILAVPLFLTVVWLVWVLYTQVGENGVGVFIFLAALTSGLILLWKKTQTMARAGRLATLSAMLVGATAAVYLTLPILAEVKQKAHPEGGDVVFWSDQEVWNLRLQGKGVFVNYTATWCLTCLVNEKLVFEQEKFQRFLAENDIVYMVADWTNYDEEIAISLEKLGRSALPVYIFYPNGGPTYEPVLLPEILTLEMALEIISANKS